MITIACVLKTGACYDRRYVERLRNCVSRNLQVRHDFVCLTDDQELLEHKPFDVIPLIHGWPGWWSKIELFRKDLFSGSTVIYFDLDTIILSNIDDLAIYPHGFSMLRAFKGDGSFASGIMAWNGDHSYIYDSFRKNEKANMIANRGDQDYIENKLRITPVAIQDIIEGVYSYKRHCLNGVPSGARIVCFHGKPRPADVSHAWMSEWRKT